MATSKIISRLLREDLVRGYAPMERGQSRVDRARGIIYGVKLAGLASANRHGLEVDGTSYLPEAYERARSLYEGAKININHPDRDNPGKDRPSQDRFGIVRNVRIVGGEPYGDIHYLKTHPMAAPICEAAEREDLHDCFAMSHNAFGKGTIKDGRYVIHEITDVRSVDVVADGGTNRSLFEAEEPMAKKKTSTLRSLLESSAYKATDPLKRSLLEMDDSMLDATMPEEAGGGDWKQLLSQAIGALIQSDKPEDHEMAKKILAMVKPGSSSGGGKDALEESEEEDGKNKKDDKETMESLRRELDSVKLDLSVRELCESAGFAPSKAQLKALKGLSTKADREELIKELKESRASTSKVATKAPRSTPAGSRPLTESKEVTDGKSFAAAISGRR